MSRQYVSDAELAAEWPHLTRRMLRDLKDAFALFDLDGACASLIHFGYAWKKSKQTLRVARAGGGTISTSELGEVLKSMGTNATQVPPIGNKEHQTNQGVRLPRAPSPYAGRA